ncbi:4-hydroxy-3-methylbut-2-en-1-yl diphosphate synthase (flavodoxin) [Dirofilaria immitis]
MIEYQDERALQVFQKSLTVDNEGRCVADLPWKNQEEIAPAKGYGLAQGRLRSTVGKLKKSPELLKRFDENFLEEGVIEKIKNQNEISRVSCLP